MRLMAGGLLCVLASVVVASARPAAAGPEDRIPSLEGVSSPAEACTAMFPKDAFVKVPSEGEVQPGQQVSVDVTWRTAWHTGKTVDVVGCVASDGRFVGDAGTLARGVENNGLFVHRFSVPAGSVKGIKVCEAAVIIGPGAGGAPAAERTDPDCFEVAGSAAPAAAAPAAAEPAAAPAAPASHATQGQEASASAGSREAAASGPVPVSTPPDRTAIASTQMPPVAPGAADPAHLPRTGRGDRRLTAAAGVLLMLGGLTLGSGRRRPGSGQR